MPPATSKIVYKRPGHLHRVRKSDPVLGNQVQFINPLNWAFIMAAPLPPPGGAGAGAGGGGVPGAPLSPPPGGGPGGPGGLGGPNLLA